jgi:hypothetical protein
MQNWLQFANKSQLISKEHFGIIFLFELFLEAMVKNPYKNFVGFLVDLKTPKCPFEIN